MDSPPERRMAVLGQVKLLQVKTRDDPKAWRRLILGIVLVLRPRFVIPNEVCSWFRNRVRIGIEPAARLPFGK
jgi:hypothetical protein